MKRRETRKQLIHSSCAFGESERSRIVEEGGAIEPK
jgi:hypothetical protein